MVSIYYCIVLYFTQLSVSSVLHLDKHFVFKPVSVQALWTVIQTLHLITGKLKVNPFLPLSAQVLCTLIHTLHLITIEDKPV